MGILIGGHETTANQINLSLLTLLAHPPQLALLPAEPALIPGAFKHALDSRLILAQDADVTARLMQNLPPVLGALQPTKDAMLRVGALLIVKVDWTVSVFQLTAAQQARLDHHPQPATSPREIAAVLNLIPEEDPVGGSYPVEGGRARKIDPLRAAGQSRLRGPGPAA